MATPAPPLTLTIDPPPTPTPAMQPPTPPPTPTLVSSPQLVASLRAASTSRPPPVALLATARPTASPAPPHPDSAACAAASVAERNVDPDCTSASTGTSSSTSASTGDKLGEASPAAKRLLQQLLGQDEQGVRAQAQRAEQLRQRALDLAQGDFHRRPVSPQSPGHTDRLVDFERYFEDQYRAMRCFCAPRDQRLWSDKSKSARHRVDREELVSRMIEICRDSIRHEAELFKALNLEFGTTELSEGRNAGDYSMIWVPEGGGAQRPPSGKHRKKQEAPVEEIAEDLGGLTTEAFSMFWEKVVVREYSVEGIRMFNFEDGVCLPMSDEQLPSNEDKRRNVLKFFHGVGRVALWAMIQRQPVPSSLMSKLLLSELIGVDVLCGPEKPLPLEGILPVDAANGKGNNTMAVAAAAASGPDVGAADAAESPGCRPEHVHLMSLPEIVELLDEIGGSTYRNRHCVFALLLQDSAVGKQVKQVLDMLDEKLPNEDAVITPNNQVGLWRELVRHVLVDRRRMVLRALRAGFSGWSLHEASRRLPPRGSAFATSAAVTALNSKQRQTAWNLPPVHHAVQLLRHLSFSERQTAVCGNEEIDADTIVRHLKPTGKGFSIARPHPNFRHLVSVLQDEKFQHHLTDFLRFVTASTSVKEVTNIAVQFTKQLNKTHLPQAQTCFSKLMLPHEAYGSRQDLFDKLVICTANATGFGAR